MKLAFDEHIPPVMAEIFQNLADHRGIRRLCPDLVIKSAKEYAPKPKDQDYLRRNDAPWVKRFAHDGGHLIISGDKKMRSNPVEREALLQANVVVFFFDPAWNNMQFCDKCAMLLHWWPALLQTTQNAPRPSFWRIPAVWKADAGIVQVPHSDLKLERITRQKAARPAIAAARNKRRSAPSHDSSQTEMDLNGLGSADEPIK